MATETLSPGQARPAGTANSTAANLRARFARISLDARLATLAVLAFLGVTIWWLTQDTRVPDWDSAQHMLDSFIVHDSISSGSWTTPFTEFNTYPPLAHIVGALGVFVDGYRRAAVIFALNLVFVPSWPSRATASASSCRARAPVF